MDNDGFDIAIIGISCEFPKSENKDVYWDNLERGIECLTDLTFEMLRSEGIKKDRYDDENYVARAGILNDIDKFAAKFFGLSRRDAEAMDPQHRRLLEHAWWALEDACIDPYESEETIGFYTSASLNTYLINNLLEHPEIRSADYSQQILFGNGYDYLATRVAHFMNLTGPIMTMQSACSSSLVVVHQACHALLSYQADVMLAGGVTIKVPQQEGYMYSIDGILSRDGHCKAFDANASGTIFTNGIGIIVLKRLKDALRDNDDIYAVIKGSAINNDGKNKVSYMAPNLDGQTEVIAMAQAVSNVDPETISYIEAHGTATSIGDPVEIAALTKAFRLLTQKRQFCAIGSVKTNIGHLDVAAGIAGLIKVALSLKKEKIPPSLFFNSPNPKLNLADSPFYVNTKLRTWKSVNKAPLRAAVSSFGIGGTNAHAILEAPPTSKAHDVDLKNYIVALSAKSHCELRLMCCNLSKYVKQNPDVSLLNLSYTLKIARSNFSYRRVIVFSNSQELISALELSFKPQFCDRNRENFDRDAAIDELTRDELIKLGNKWLDGHIIVWNKLYRNLNTRRLHLPTYPFVRERYWIDSLPNLDKKNTNVAEWFYFPSFKRDRLKDSSIKSLIDSSSLLFLNRDNYSEQLYKELKLSSKHVFVVYAGDKFKKISNYSFEINSDSFDDYAALFEAIKLEEIKLKHIVHLWSLRVNQSPIMGIEKFDEVQSNGLYSIIRVVLALQKLMCNETLYFSIVSSCIQAISGNEMSNPNLATLNALPKVIPKEFSNIKMQLIDVGQLNEQYRFQIKHMLLPEIAKSNYSVNEVVFRGQQRWIREYTKTLIDKVENFRPSYLKPGKVILITGGMGQMGLDISDYFAKLGSLTLVLLTRSSFLQEDKWDQWLKDYGPSNLVTEKILRVRSLRDSGLKVVIKKADVSDYELLEKVVDEVRSTYGAINGVIHAAGDTGNGVVAVQDPSRVDAYYPAFSAKVYGSYNLARLFEQSELEFMILCSSMNAIIGGLGQLENTVVNVFIDHFAEYLSKRVDYNVLAINWGAVNLSRPARVNVLSQFSELSAEHKKNYMDDNETHEVYSRLLNYSLGPRLLISTVNIDDVLYNWNRVASLKELAKDRPLLTKDKHAIDFSSIENFILNCWRQILGADGVKFDDNFFELGGHSLAAIQIINKISDKFGIKIHVMTLFQIPILKDFCRYVEKMHSASLAKQVMERENA